MIRVTCVCGRALTYGPEFAGKRLKCPKCGKPVQVPAPEVVKCAAHPEIRSTGSCAQCRAPICAECRALFGYYCSEGCKVTGHQAREQEPPAPPPPPDRSPEIWRWFRRGAIAAGILVLLGGAFLLIRHFLDRGGETAWTADLDGAFARDLFVQDGSLYLVCTGGGISRYDPKSGEKQGGFALDGEVVARDGDTLLVLTAGKTSAVGLADGRVLWSRESCWPESAHEGRVCLRSISSATCVDLRTGADVWNRTFEFGALNGIAAGCGRTFLLLDDEVHMVDATGATIWKANCETTLVRPTEAGLLCEGNRLRMLSYADGSVRWELPLGDRDAPKIQVHGGRVFCHVSSVLCCLDLATGEIRWRAAAPAMLSSLEIGADAGFVGGFASEDLLPKLDDPLLPLAGREILRDVVRQELGSLERLKSFVYAFDPATGRVRWQKMNAGSSCRPAGDRLLVWGTLSAANLLDPTKRFVAREAIRCLDADDGDVLWEFETDSIATPLVVHGEMLYYARSQHGGNTAGASEPVEPRAVESRLIAVRLK